MKNKKGFTASSFDLLHAGHITMLEECRSNCTHLVVGLNVAPLKNGVPPVQGVFERYVQLNAVKWVDEIVPYNGEDELVELLNTLNIDVRFVGEDYKNVYFTGKDINERNLTEIYYNRRQHNFSSSALKNLVIGNRELEHKRK